MSSNKPEFYQLTLEDVPKAGKILADAFEHDPIWENMLKGCSLKKRSAWFESPVKYCMKYGNALATSPDIEGFIGWLPGEYSEMTFRRMMKSGASKSGKKAGFKPMLRMAPLKIFDEDRKKHMVGRAYLYVMIVGVSPQSQGQGFGGQLIKHVISEGKKTGLPIYLETSTKNNLTMYEHLGFQTLAEINLPKLNLPQWEMLWDPPKNTL